LAIAGSYLADFVVNHFHSLEKVYTKIINLLAKILGASSPDSRKVLKQLTQRGMQEFNREITDSPAVYYQSYGSMLKNGCDDPVFYPTYRILYGKGISHREVTDFKRRPISGTDIPTEYLRIVQQLKEKGY
jgi:triacylglycerol lipase